MLYTNCDEFLCSVETILIPNITNIFSSMNFKPFIVTAQISALGYSVTHYGKYLSVEFKNVCLLKKDNHKSKFQEPLDTFYIMS
jgi:hypothetical protein